MNENYSQPDFYRFNSDSIGLVTYLSKILEPTASILDLGAGSGIIGIELARRLKPQRLVLVELQKEFYDHMKKNCEEFLPPEIEKDIVISSFADFSPSMKFNLIVCNPPYYLPDSGQLASSMNRALCRSFLVDSWVILLDKVYLSLAVQGKAFFVFKNDRSSIHLLKQKMIHLFLDIKLIEFENLIIVELSALDKE